MQSAGGVSQRRFHRWLNLFFDTVLHVAVVDGNDRDTFVEKCLRIGLLVAAAPTAAVDLEHDRRWLVRFRLIKIKNLSRMAALRHVDELLGFIGGALLRDEK